MCANPEHAGRRDTRREILWEAKRAENWSETWLQKRKADHIQLLPRPVNRDEDPLDSISRRGRRDVEDK